MNKIIKYISLLTLIFSLTGCAPSEQVLVNIENAEQLHNTTLGKDNLIKISNGLYYDSATRIVYLYFYTAGGYSYMSAYYAPNGLPYRYNPETNEFEEIGGTK